MTAGINRRILVVDDNATIHADYRKILGLPEASTGALAEAKAAFFGAPAEAKAAADGFELESAHQGEEALERVRAARAAGRPFALAFVDVRMPPGMDGVETVARLWELDAELQVVICTAFADYSWDEMSRKLGQSDRLLILKKPFDPIEVVQLATALTEKWNSAQRERERLAEVRRAEQEARAYAASLATFNRALETAKASAESASTGKSEFLERLAGVLQVECAALMAALELAGEPGLAAEQRQQGLLRAHDKSIELRNAARNLALQSALELGKLEPEPGSFEPGPFLDRIAARWRERAASLGLRLGSECVGRVPERVRGDASLVSGILDALVDNALRFTTQGGVKLQACMPTPEPGADAELLLSVGDSGPGIAPDVLHRIFEPLARSDEGDALGQGAHFSLSVARGLARHLGGELEAESTPGEGTTVRLRLPIGDASALVLVDHPRGPLPACVPDPVREQAPS